MGFDTALNTVVQAISKIRDTSFSHERIFIIEVMGRKSGFIALEAGIASGADITLIPEHTYPLFRVVNTIKNSIQRGKRSILIILAEGVASAENYKKLLEEKLKIPNVEIKYSVLGYIQRGGSPSAFDRLMAARFGIFAVEQFLKGKTKIMVSYEKGELKTKPLSVSFGKVKKPKEEDIEFNNVLSLY